MSRWVILLAFVQLAAAQSLPDPSPAIEAQAKLPEDGLLVKALQVFAPAQPGPLTEQQRLNDYLTSTFGPAPLFSAALTSGLSQWIDSPPEWGQGGVGYGRRYASHMGYHIVRSSLAYATSMAFGEDDRYHASNQTAIHSRLLHVLISPVLAYHQDGSESFSFSSATGIVGAAALSRLWVPDSWQGTRHVVKSIWITYAATAGVNCFREFVPDLIRKVRGMP